VDVLTYSGNEHWAELRRIPGLEAEIERLRKGLWECARVAGEDTDGGGPQHLAHPDIVEYAVKAVADLREAYDEANS
jgi:hypothetical protein